MAVNPNNKVFVVNADINTQYGGVDPTGEFVAVSELGGSSYKVYTALLTQVGSPSSDPTAVVLENTLANQVTITRNSTGNYSITCADFTDVNKVYVELKNIGLLSSSFPSQYAWFTVNSGAIVINTTQINLISNSIEQTDFLLDKTPIEIRVYS